MDTHAQNGFGMKSTQMTINGKNGIYLKKNDDENEKQTSTVTNGKRESNGTQNGNLVGREYRNVPNQIYSAVANCNNNNTTCTRQSGEHLNRFTRESANGRVGENITSDETAIGNGNYHELGDEESLCTHTHRANKKIVVWLAISVSLFIYISTKDNGNGFGAFEEYGYFSAIFLYFISAVPYLSLPFAIGNLIGFARYNPYYLPPKHKSLSNAPFVCFRMVTRGDYREFVIKNAIMNKNICKAFGLEKFVIEIVSDKPINLPCGDRYIREIVVPEHYQSKRKTLFKARALHYCNEENVNTLNSTDWLVHLDEETLVSEDALIGIYDFILRNKADIGQGPISYIQEGVVHNWLTSLADCIRPAIDYGIFRFQFSVLHAPLFGFKGSYIVINSKVERDIGLDLGPEGSLAEDCYFALKAWSKGYTFEFIPGEMNENSPITIMDFVRQRKRWFVGQFYTVLSDEIPLLYKLGILLSVTCSMLILISLCNVPIHFLFPFDKPILFSLLTGFTGGTFSFLYAFGAFHSLSKRNWSLTKLTLISVLNGYVILTVAAVLEGAAVLWGMLTLNKFNEFYIIKKCSDSTTTKKTC